jgi:hypothetical protein
MSDGRTTAAVDKLEVLSGSTQQNIVKSIIIAEFLTQDYWTTTFGSKEWMLNFTKGSKWTQWTNTVNIGSLRYQHKNELMSVNRVS